MARCKKKGETLDPFMFLTDYKELGSFVRCADSAISWSRRPDEVECDEHLIAALIGYIYDWGELFANPNRKSDVQNTSFHAARKLSQCDEGTLDTMFLRFLKRGERLDRETYRWVRDFSKKPVPNGIGVTEYEAWKRYGEITRKKSLYRVSSLFAYLDGEGLGSFEARLCRDLAQRALMFSEIDIEI